MTTQSSNPAALDSEQLLQTLTAIKNGDLSARMPAGQPGIEGQIAEMVNALAEMLTAFTSEAGQICREIGVEGKFGGQAEVRGVAGTWKDLIANYNLMSANLTGQVRDVTHTVHLLVRGDPSRKVTVEANGETLLLKDEVNALVDQHNRTASTPPQLSPRES